MNRRLSLVSIFGVFVLGACSEKSDVAHKQATYQGKPDNVPWQSKPFDNDKTAWENALRVRNNSQNEYARISAGRAGGAQ